MSNRNNRPPNDAEVSRHGSMLSPEYRRKVLCHMAKVGRVAFEAQLDAAQVSNLPGRRKFRLGDLITRILSESPHRFSFVFQKLLAQVVPIGDAHTHAMVSQHLARANALPLPPPPPPRYAGVRVKSDPLPPAEGSEGLRARLSAAVKIRDKAEQYAISARAQVDTILAELVR